MQSLNEILNQLKTKAYGNSLMAFCPCHDNTRTPALSISYDNHNDKLLVYCHAGCDSVDVLKAINGSGVNIDYKPSSNGYQVNQSDDYKEQYIDKVLGEVKPIKGTIAEHYLRNERCISCEISNSIKFHPKLKHSPTQKFYPAMVSIIQEINKDKVIGIHRTYLTPEGKKANIEHNKMIFGKLNSGCVILNQGGFNSKYLVVGEGIETSLSLKMLYPDEMVVSCLSSSGMKNLVLPSKSSKLIIGIDNDEAGMIAGELLGTRAIVEGWEVSIITPQHGNDWNDTIKANKCGWII
jgi:hypothetical protein